MQDLKSDRVETLDVEEFQGHLIVLARAGWSIAMPAVNIKGELPRFSSKGQIQVLGA